MLLPLIRPPRLYHVGAFDGHRPRGASFEGDALSASPCPAAWRGIARLGDAPVWRLDKTAPRMIDAHALTPLDLTTLDLWGIATGRVRRVPVWRVWDTDENDVARYMEFPERDAAREEAHDRLAGLDIDPDADGALEAVMTAHDGLVATTGFAARSGHRDHTELLRDLLLIDLADALGLDGVYWADLLDPANLSAPRAAIPAGRVPAFRAYRLAGDPDDSDALTPAPTRLDTVRLDPLIAA